ncbi:MAG: hypothetical protein ACR2IE_11120 [Candidatus Sumerlaeaceae bacterium]
MSPLVITIALFAATVAAGTIAGGLVFIGVGEAIRTRIDQGRAFGAAFMGSFISAMVYTILLKVLDKTDQPLISGPFFMAAAAGVVVSFLAVLKSFEVEPNKVPMLWLPFAAVLVASFYLSRTMGDEWREKHGFYRGFEGVAGLNMLDPPDAMSTPEKAVNYYNSQYKKLQEANEDEGIGKLLTTSTHWDAKWFNDNFGYITHNMGKSDPFGITKVVQDPKQHKVMALAHIARPIFGRVKQIKEDGNEALVLMDRGQLVRLHKEGRNWKVRDWLGMRPLVMRDIYEQKEKDGTLSAEDRAARQADYKQYEEDTRALALRLGVPYSPYNPSYDEDEGGPTGRKRGSGFAALDAAKPGELVDLSAQPASTAQTTQPAPNRQLTTQQKLALLNNQLDAQVASMSGQATPVGAVTADEAAQDPNAFYKAAQAQAIATPAPGVPAFIQGISADILWPGYFQAIAKIERGDTTGIREFLNCTTNEDAAWFQRNYTIIADLVTPGAQYTPEQAQLVALQAMARSMPHVSNVKPAVRTNQASGVAKFVEPGGGPLNTYTTLLAQESGRWVLAHPFFARTFIWVPQIAAYKHTKGMPLGEDERSVLTTGLGPMQLQVQKIYQQLGFSG